MADFLSVADWKKNVNGLLGVIHKKTGLTEALTKYEALKKSKSPPDAKVEALDAVLKCVAKTADGHKNNKKAQEYLTGMKNQASKERTQADALNQMWQKKMVLRECLASPGLWPYFHEFCVQGQTADDMDYWLAMRKAPDYARAELLVKNYIDPKAKKGLNLPEDLYKKASTILNNTSLSKEEKLKQLLPILSKAVLGAEGNMCEPWLRFTVSDGYVRMLAKHKGFKPWV